MQAPGKIPALRCTVSRCTASGMTGTETHTRSAKGESFRFVGRCVKAGRTITVCDAQAFGRTGAHEKPIATMTPAIMAVTGRAGIEQ